MNNSLTSVTSDQLVLEELRILVGGAGHLIDGEIVGSTASFAVVAPWCDEPLGDCPDASSAQLDAAVSAAARAQGAWASDEPARRAVLIALAEVLESNVEHLGKVLAGETGKPLFIAQGEVKGAASHLRWYSQQPIGHEVLEDNEVERIELVRDPIGVIAAIVPWNAPLMMMANKIAASLLTGNTVVVKPSPFTPFASLLFGRLIKDLVPAGVINILGGGDTVGIDLTMHAQVDMVTFTGSIRAGQAIMGQLAPGLKRMQLELGGNDAAIVLPDVDVKMVAPLIYRGAFGLSGQICAAIKRLYIHADVHDELLAELVVLAKAAKPGSPFAADTTMGPSTTKPQYEFVLGLIEDARAHGAEIHSGGEALDRPGYFIPPTIVTGVSAGVAVVDKEQFGPVLPVMSFTDLDEAIAEANGTQFGLGASVWTSNTEMGLAIARRLKSGGAWVNRHPHVGVTVPFGGVKLSGIGREGGAVGIDAFSELKTISFLK